MFSALLPCNSRIYKITNQCFIRQVSARYSPNGLQKAFTVVIFPIIETKRPLVWISFLLGVHFAGNSPDIGFIRPHVTGHFLNPTGLEGQTNS
jgi:hypothetical protein